MLVSVDGDPASSSDAVRAAVQRHQPGDTFPVVVRRDGKEQTVTAKTTEADGRTVMGVGLRLDYDLPVDVTLRTGSVGGPSAGLMFSLAIYDALTPGELTGGEKIAGTGTLDDAGTVGPIGGIRQKLIGARRAGADFFLAPADNCADIGDAVPDGLRVVRVGTFDEGREAVRGDRRRQGGIPADLRLSPRAAAAQSSLKVARRACTRPGAMSSPSATRSSLSWSRWRSRQRAAPSRVTATSSRTSARPGCSATARSAVGVVIGQLALGLRGHHDPLDGEGAPGHLLRPGDPGQQVLQARGLRQLVLLHGAQRPGDGVVGGHPVGEVRFVREQVLRRHEGEQAHRLVPPRAGDVPLGVEGSEGEGVGHGLGGVGHRTMVPDGARR